MKKRAKRHEREVNPVENHSKPPDTVLLMTMDQNNSNVNRSLNQNECGTNVSNLE
jgi:hypothetical protein